MTVSAGPSWSGRWLGAVLVTEALALTYVRLPASFRFATYAFQDSGADLALQSLVNQGDRPGVDDGYLYGYLPVAVGRLWYALFGLRPIAFQAAAFLTGVALAWGMARFARAVNAGRAGSLLLVLCLPSILPAAYPFLTHMLESALLCHALAEHARGRRPFALALLTACVFVKPSLAYVYGFLLTLLFLSGRGQGASPHGWLGRLRPLLPAAVVAAVLGLGLGVLFGFDPVIHSLDPSRGMAVYRANHFGFFRGIGRDFWRPQGARLNYYLGTFTGFWLAGSVTLIAGSVALWARRERGRNCEVALFCAVLHVAFVTLMFGNAWSWVFYSDILVLGLVALSPYVRGKLLTAVALVLFGLAILAQRSTLLPYVLSWRTLARSPETAGLWADSTERREWTAVRETLGGQTAVLLAQSDGAAVFVPSFEPPAVLYLAPGQARPVELARKRAQIESAALVVEAAAHGGHWPSDLFPELGHALSGCERVFDGSLFRVYERIASASPRRAGIVPAASGRP